VKNSQKVVIIFSGDMIGVFNAYLPSRFYLRFTRGSAGAPQMRMSLITAPCVWRNFLGKGIRWSFNTIKQGVFEHFFIQKPLVL
jgi:hypothetical protein